MLSSYTLTNYKCAHTVPQVCTLGALDGPSLELCTAGDGFDWRLESIERERKSSVSPDLLPSIFRSRKESLVDVEFDHERAALGEQPRCIGALSVALMGSCLLLCLCQVHDS